MADTAKSPKKKASKPRKPADHPKYSEMIRQAIVALKERGGSSRQAILKYIMKSFKVSDERSANAHLKMALKAGVTKGSLKQAKGTGASGSFKIASDTAEKKPKAAKPKVKTPKKAKKAKKPAAKKSAKKPSVKKAATPKKAAKPKTKKASPKKVAKPKVKKASPKKKAAKPKTQKPKAKKSSPKKKSSKK